MCAHHPRAIEQLRPFNLSPVAQKVIVLHHEHAVIAKLMFERLERSEPVWRPLL